MKFLGLVLVIFSAQFASAASGSALKKQVVNLEACYGVQNLDGYYIQFYSDGSAFVNEVKFAKNTPAYLSNAPYSKYSLYSKYMEYGSFEDYNETTWRVKGSQVLVRFGSKEYSLLIGFKNHFCSVN